LTCRIGTAYLKLVSLPPKKLGLLVSCAVTEPGFGHGVRLAAAALEKGVDVYLYCIDNGVTGVRDPELQSLRQRGLKLYACAYGAHQRGLPVDDTAVYAGLTVVSDLIASTDRFVSFN
jgi:sulfur relay (sulfurtransferase) complex TusBCD TusD component (DsrE family)